MDETGAHYTEWSKSERKTPIQYTNTYIRNLEHGDYDPICKTVKETQMYRTVFWTLWEKVRVGWFERISLKHVLCIIIYETHHSPGSMHETGCSGLVHWDDPEGWGFRLGNTCTEEKKINIMSLGFIGLSYGEQSKLGLSNSFSFNISPWTPRTDL